MLIWNLNTKDANASERRKSLILEMLTHQREEILILGKQIDLFYLNLKFWCILMSRLNLEFELEMTDKASFFYMLYVSQENI